MLGAISQYKKYINYLESDSYSAQEKMILVRAYLKTQRAIGTYVKVKFFTSFLTGLCYAIVCFAFGLDFYILWGFLAFSLNFIPAIGSIISSIPPILMGLMYFDSTGTLILLILILAAVQVVIGSILDPKLMGKNLSLNFVTVVLGIVFWGTLWGTAGMILSVPMMVLLKIILEQLPDTGILVKLMESQKVKTSSPLAKLEKTSMPKDGLELRATDKN
jgi:predicted PurR-regulated permease PerM